LVGGEACTRPPPVVAHKAEGGRSVLKEPIPSARWSRVAWLLVLFSFAALALWAFYNPEWRRPPEPGYAGPEVQPRTVSVPSTLGSDELATIAVFERASQSVVFIVNRALRRNFFSLNPVEVPRWSRRRLSVIHVWSSRVTYGRRRSCGRIRNVVG
jgi:hypothetical protein